MIQVDESGNVWALEAGDWFWRWEPKDFKPMSLKERKKCCSCSSLIDVGAPAVEHEKRKVPETDEEIRIYGEEGEIPIASEWMCEPCGDIYFSLAKIGYPVVPLENMRHLAKKMAKKHNELCARWEKTWQKVL